MKKKNNIKKFIKENYYFTFLLIPFIFFCITNRIPDNDIWFILNNGRYVLSHSIPHIDPFTIHTGLHYVMQQWLSAVIFYTFYKKLGRYGILTLMFISFWLLTYIYYKLCYLISNDKKKSIIIVCIILSIISVEYIVTRPQIFTYIILLLETYLLELYIKKDNKKFLIPLPFLSVLLINLQCSMWFLQFVFILPFIVNGLRIKGLTVKKINIKPILVTMLIMFIVGFINPYGIEAITFIFKSYGIKEFNNSIGEMKAASFEHYAWKWCILGLFSLIAYLNYNKKAKLDIRFLLFITGTFILAAMHIKCIVYCLIWSGYALSNLKINITIKNNLVKRLVNTILLSIGVSLLIIIIPTLSLLIKNYRFDNPRIEPMVNYLDKEYDKNKVTLYVSFNEGGYTEYRGYKSYIDPRAEVFVLKLNQKEDIFNENNLITNNPTDEEINSFLKKYNFTHIIVKNDTTFERYLKEKTDYIAEYTIFFDNEKTVPLKKLYVRKDISVLQIKKEQERKDKNEK